MIRQIIKNKTLSQIHMRTLLILIIFLIGHLCCLGHSDYTYTKNYGDVSIRITTGFRYEEINQTFILGEYANYLLEEYNFHLPIIINYRHSYTSSNKPEYFVSVGKGNYKATCRSASNSGKLSKKETLIVRIFGSNLNISEALKVIEFGIKSHKQIKSNQFDFETNYKHLYWNYNFKTFPPDSLKKICKEDISETVNKIISKKVYKPESDKDKNFNKSTGIGYYTQNDCFHVYAKQWKQKDTLLISIPDLFWFERVNYDKAIIFDTDTSFYYADWKSQSKAYLSKRKIITNRQNKYHPLEITEVKDDKIFISYLVPYKDSIMINGGSQISVTSGYRNRTTYYHIKDDILINDFDEFMKNAR